MRCSPCLGGSFHVGRCGGWYLAGEHWYLGLACVACGPTALTSTTPGIENNPFLRAFFFSVETLSTIGYGNIVPTGVAANV